MRKVIVGGSAALLLSLNALPAFADNQPSNGVSSTGRNDAGFGAGPHCHVVAVNQGKTPFEFIVVYPSHTGHAHAGGDIFTADPDCNGIPGNQAQQP